MFYSLNLMSSLCQADTILTSNSSASERNKIKRVDTNKFKNSNDSHHKWTGQRLVITSHANLLKLFYFLMYFKIKQEAKCTS